MFAVTMGKMNKKMIFFIAACVYVLVSCDSAPEIPELHRTPYPSVVVTCILSDGGSSWFQYTQEWKLNDLVLSDHSGNAIYSFCMGKQDVRIGLALYKRQDDSKHPGQLITSWRILTEDEGVMSVDNVSWNQRDDLVFARGKNWSVKLSFYTKYSQYRKIKGVNVSKGVN